MPPSRLKPNAMASVERPRQGRLSLGSRTAAQSAYRRKQARASRFTSPPSSQATSDEAEVKAALARFEEWPLKDALLKRITENGIAPLQLLFSWNSYVKHGVSSVVSRDRVDSPPTKTADRSKPTATSRARFSS